MKHLRRGNVGPSAPHRLGLITVHQWSLPREPTRTPFGRTSVTRPQAEREKADGPSVGIEGCCANKLARALKLGAPYGTRTRVSAVKGRCPRPLDEGRGGGATYRELCEREQATRRAARLTREVSGATTTDRYSASTPMAPWVGVPRLSAKARSNGGQESAQMPSCRRAAVG